MIRNILFSAIVSASFLTTSAMSEFDTLAEMIVSGFHSGNPVSAKFISDWTHTAPTKLIERICSNYAVQKDSPEEEEMLTAMNTLLETQIGSSESVKKFHATMSSIAQEDKRLATLLIFNYMYRQ